MTTNTHFRSFQLMLSVNVNSDSGLRVAQTVQSGDSFTLAVSSSVHLTRWQTVYVSIRSSEAHEVYILENSTFYVALMGM